jgi:CMP-N-acetylneuraminic acid synthetase
MNERKAFALIPARGGSKRFPRKNIALLRGRPLLAWTIQPALKSGIFDQVYVSSEDDEILALSAQWGATPLPRDPSLADDHVTLVMMLLSLLGSFQAVKKGYTDLYLLLPTTPMRRAQGIREAWERYVSSGADSLLSVMHSDHPPQWILTEQNGWLKPLMPDMYELPRQELPLAYCHDGGHLITRISSFLREGRILNERTISYQVPREEAVDVNEPLDLAWAEFILKKRKDCNIE